MRLEGAVIALVVAVSFTTWPGCDTNGSQDCPDASVEIPSMEAYFSPLGGVQDELIHLMNSAQDSLDIAVYLITSQDLAGSIIAAHERGVRVRMVVDAGTCEEISYSQCDVLEAAGVQIRRRMTSGIMHNKFLVVDERIVGTGSYNWSNSAEENNDENFLVIESRDLAQVYSAEFVSLFGN